MCEQLSRLSNVKHLSDYFDAAAEEVDSESSRSIDPSHATALISVGAQALVCSERSESKLNATEKITSPVVNLALYFVVGATAELSVLFFAFHCNPQKLCYTFFSSHRQAQIQIQVMNVHDSEPRPSVVIKVAQVFDICHAGCKGHTECTG